MAAILSNLRNTVVASIVLVILLIILMGAWHDAGIAFDHGWWAFAFRGLHVLGGIVWIGILS